jgi:anti-sigma factor ChrR (cupin superfamily)
MDSQHMVLQPWSKDAVKLPNGQIATKLVIGDESDPRATRAFIVKWPPNCVVEVHTHHSDYCEVILEGTQKVGADWFSAGDVRLAKASTMYGPLMAGEEGCTIIVIFNGDGWMPIPARQSHLDGIVASDMAVLKTAGSGKTKS